VYNLFTSHLGCDRSSPLGVRDARDAIRGRKAREQLHPLYVNVGNFAEDQA